MQHPSHHDIVLIAEEKAGNSKKLIDGFEPNNPNQFYDVPEMTAAREEAKLWNLYAERVMDAEFDGYGREQVAAVIAARVLGEIGDSEFQGEVELYGLVAKSLAAREIVQFDLGVDAPAM